MIPVLVYAAVLLIMFGVPIYRATRLGKPKHLIRCKFCLREARKYQVCSSDRNLSRWCESEIG